MTSTVQDRAFSGRPSRRADRAAAQVADAAARARALVAATALVGFGAAVLVAWFARADSLGVVAAAAIAAAVGGVAVLAIRWAGSASASVAGARNRSLDVDLASSPGAVTDSAGKVVAANQAFWRAFARVTVEHISDLAELAVDRDTARAVLEQQLGPDEALVTSTLMQVKSGERERHFRVRVRREDAGRRLLWTFDDVSEEHAAGERARAEAAQYRTLLDRLPVGACQIDAAGMLRFANAQFAALARVAVDEAAEGRLRWSDLAAELIPAPEPNQAGQISLKDSAGELHRASWFEAPVEEGEAAGGTVGVVVPRPKGRGTQAPGDLAQRFSDAIQRAPVGIALLDPSGAVVYANPAFGRIAFPGGTEPAPERKLRGRPLGAFVADADREATEAQLTQAVTVREPAAAIDVAWKSKHTVIVSITFTPMTGDDGAIDCVLATVVDITSQRQLEQQFTQAQKMQAVGQLAGGVAHDFNNLLTAMIGFCDLLLGRLAPGDQSYEDVHQIQQNANRAANLVRQLLAFSRKQTMTPRVVNLTDTVAELGHMLRRLLGEGIELNIVYARDLWQVKVDESQLQHVIINLAVNARDAMRGRGTLTIETANFAVVSEDDMVHEAMPPGDYVCIKVIDTGHGIEKHIIDRIWEPFFTTKEMGAGTGLGLSTCYGIVKQTGGFIFADSVVGEGSTFSVYLPRHIPVEGELQVKEVVRKARDLTGVGRVLLVEDEDAVRLFSTRALKNKGYEVLAANGGEQALELLEEAENKIDLLITDVMMPEMDGPTLIKEVRERIPDIKAICISGYAEDTIRDRLADDTDIHFLAKPFNLEDLATMVKEVLSE